jgi:hypothetical protein
MSRNIKSILIYHRHKLLDLIYITSMYLVYIRSSGIIIIFFIKCKDHDIVPKGLILKVPYHGHLSSKKNFRSPQGPAKK